MPGRQHRQCRQFGERRFGLWHDGGLSWLAAISINLAVLLSSATAGAKHRTPAGVA